MIIVNFGKIEEVELKTRTANTGLAKVPVHFSVSTFVLNATFAKSESVMLPTTCKHP
jgi:hypothetical protein